jgi:hypothetical protein
VSQQATTRGLPPVEPPSGRMFIQLFFVPLLIVGVLVGLYLVGSMFLGKGDRSRSGQAYLRDLDNANPDIRWRAASDLSQQLPRSPEMAADATFALALADRLKAALVESAAAEKDYAAKSEGMTDAERDKTLNKELAPRRNLIMYLGACLGNFVVPVGVPPLKQMALQTAGMEPDALAERRGRALFALAVLGENLKRYDEQSGEDKARIDEELSAAKDGQAFVEYLNQRRAGKADSLGVAEALRQCSEDDDPYLRELTALASNFWTGTGREQATIEEYLVKLSLDDGRGEEKLAERQARNPDAKRSRAISKRKGFQVQANANLALARRGSPKVRLDLLAEMLDPAVLREVFVLRLPGRGKESAREEPDEALVVVTVTSSLRALADLRKARPEMKLDKLKEKVESLADDKNAAVGTEAKKTLQAF